MSISESIDVVSISLDNGVIPDAGRRSKSKTHVRCRVGTGYGIGGIPGLLDHILTLTNRQLLIWTVLEHSRWPSLLNNEVSYMRGLHYTLQEICLHG